MWCAARLSQKSGPFQAAPSVETYINNNKDHSSALRRRPLPLTNDTCAFRVAFTILCNHLLHETAPYALLTSHKNWWWVKELNYTDTMIGSLSLTRCVYSNSIITEELFAFLSAASNPVSLWQILVSNVSFPEKPIWTRQPEQIYVCMCLLSF